MQPRQLPDPRAAGAAPPPRRGATEGGFTLVELMIALSAGFLVAMAVFALARDSTRFYQGEQRFANTTFGSVVGFQRLVQDVARAGFLATPNVRREPTRCGNPDDGGQAWPAGLANLVSLRVEVGGSAATTQITDAGLSPDRVTIAGSFTTAEQFPINTIESAGGNFNIYLQPNSGPMVRAGFGNLGAVFPVGRGLRVVDRTGGTHYLRIVGVGGTAAQPYVTVSNAPVPQFRSAGSPCGLRENEVGALVNPVSFVRYQVRALDPVGDPGYAWIAANGAFDAPWDAGRAELIRDELDVTDTVIDGTQELVAEYAVDLKVALTVATTGVAPTLSYVAFGAAGVGAFTANTDAVTGPQRIRSARLRLSLRSRQADRGDDVMDGRPDTYPLVAPFRMSLGDGFARVRTLQADVALRNHNGVTW